MYKFKYKLQPMKVSFYTDIAYFVQIHPVDVEVIHGKWNFWPAGGATVKVGGGHQSQRDSSSGDHELV